MSDEVSTVLFSHTPEPPPASAVSPRSAEIHFSHQTQTTQDSKGDRAGRVDVGAEGKADRRVARTGRADG